MGGLTKELLLFSGSLKVEWGFQMTDLVKRLSSGSHLVSAERYKSGGEFKEAINRGFVLIKFTETRGGTELGVRLDRERNAVDLTNPSGMVQLVGTLELDYHRVECVVEIDVDTRKGVGSLRHVGNVTEPSDVIATDRAVLERTLN